MSDTFISSHYDLYGLMEECNRAIKSKKLHPKDYERMLRDILNKGEKSSQEFYSFIDTLEKLKSENLETEDKIKKYYKIFDDIKNRMLADDRESRYATCKDAFGADIWEKLDEQSKEYIITASYLENFLKSNAKDSAPIVIELCRSFENELKKKIFEDYIQKESKEGNFGADDELYKNLIKAINDNVTRGHYFLSIIDMVSLLYNVATDKGDGIKEKFKEYLEAEKWCLDKNKVVQFRNDSVDYTNEYRNKAAHASERVFGFGEIDICREKTKGLMGSFFGLKSSI